MGNCWSRFLPQPAKNKVWDDADLVCTCISYKACGTNRKPNNLHRYTYILHFCWFSSSFLLYSLVIYSFNFTNQASSDSQEGLIDENITKFPSKD